MVILEVVPAISHQIGVDKPIKFIGNCGEKDGGDR